MMRARILSSIAEFTVPCAAVLILYAGVCKHHDLGAFRLALGARSVFSEGAIEVVACGLFRLPNADAASLHCSLWR